MNTLSPPSPSDPSDTPPAPSRALVVGGGGAAGNAWALGLIAGLADGGTDVTDADTIVGTSSGSTVAAQITGDATPAELYAAILSAPTPPGGGVPAAHGPGPRTSGADYLQWSDDVIRSAEDAADMRRRMGEAALARDTTDGVAADRWRATVASRLPGREWPLRRVLIPAVDARTGVPVVFDRASGVELVDAVAASTSAMTPYRIGDARYLNGGYRRNENADLAAGCDRVLVLSPFSGRSRHPSAWGMDLATQLDELRAGGSAVESVFPDEGAGDVFDANALDPGTRPRAARGGFEQGRALAAQLAAFWR